jgi:coproporphyrinogen III oxidase-like Fe-S oxidoreductase
MNIQKQNALFMPIVSRVFSDYMGTQFFPSESLMIDNNDDLKVKNILKNCYSDDKVNNLYIHIPFCKSKCYYCHCFKYISNDKTFYDKYLDYLEKEMQIHLALN